MFGNDDLVEPKIRRRREVTFLIFAGLFLGSLTMLNILGISRFIDLSFEIFGMHIPFHFAVGVLAYPITFLCTDFISEIFGVRRANLLVWIGLGLNCWVLFILWLGGVLPPNDYVAFDSNIEGMLPPLPTPENYTSSDWAFYRMRSLTFGAVIASMVAYMSAQFTDVHVFHFLKRITKGKHLWIRNNFSTLTSQLVDSSAVILITHYYAKALPAIEGKTEFQMIMIYIFSTYIFKMVSALIDTVPFYYGTKFLSRYLQIDPNHELKEHVAKKAAKAEKKALKKAQSEK